MFLLRLALRMAQRAEVNACYVPTFPRSQRFVLWNGRVTLDEGYSGPRQRCKTVASGLLQCSVRIRRPIVSPPDCAAAAFVSDRRTQSRARLYAHAACRFCAAFHPAGSIGPSVSGVGLADQLQPISQSEGA